MDESLNTTATPEVPAPPQSPEPPVPLVRSQPSAGRLRLLGIALLFISATSAGYVGGYFGTKNGQSGTTSQQAQQVVLKTQGQLISNIAKTVGTSVVSVNTTARTTQSDFFGFNQPSVQQGAGTGIILSEDGLILTNRHVAPAGTSKVSVTLSDGTEFDDVSVVGRTNANDSLDVAFLKIKDTKGHKLTPAVIGDSSKAQIGDPVIAIGNALGQFQNTVTSGIISGHGRSIQAGSSTGGSGEQLEDLFQTDAAINEGNSGGPLVDLSGKVIGINTAIAAGDAQNIGFAIPINDVGGLIKSVKESGKLQRPYLGVVYVSLTDDVAKQFHLNVNRGAYIPSGSDVGRDTSIIADGPAAKAGVKEGDIITKLNNATIDQNNSLSAILNKHAVGDKVTLTIVCNGKTQTIEATLGAAPTE